MRWMEKGPEDDAIEGEPFAFIDSESKCQYNGNIFNEGCKVAIVKLDGINVFHDHMDADKSN